jgi:hypothetical protein
LRPNVALSQAISQGGLKDQLALIQSNIAVLTHLLAIVLLKIGHDWIYYLSTEIDIGE